MINMPDPRIGYIQDAEHVTFPALSLTGQPYTRPASTLNLGQGYFVVLDPFGLPDETALTELKGLIAPTVEKPTFRKASTNEPPA